MYAKSYLNIKDNFTTNSRTTNSTFTPTNKQTTFLNKFSYQINKTKTKRNATQYQQDNYCSQPNRNWRSNQAESQTLRLLKRNKELEEKLNSYIQASNQMEEIVEELYHENKILRSQSNYRNKLAKPLVKINENKNDWITYDKKTSQSNTSKTIFTNKLLNQNSYLKAPEKIPKVLDKIPVNQSEFQFQKSSGSYIRTQKQHSLFGNEIAKSQLLSSKLNNIEDNGDSIFYRGNLDIDYSLVQPIKSFRNLAHNSNKENPLETENKQLKQMLIIMNSQCEAKNKKIIELQCKLIQLRPSKNNTFTQSYLIQDNNLKLQSKISFQKKTQDIATQCQNTLKYQSEKQINPYPLSHNQQQNSCNKCKSQKIITQTQILKGQIKENQVQTQQFVLSEQQIQTNCINNVDQAVQATDQFFDFVQKKYTQWYFNQQYKQLQQKQKQKESN